MTQEQAQRERFVRVCKAKIALAEDAVQRAQQEIRTQTELLRVAEKSLAELLEETAPPAAS